MQDAYCYIMSTAPTEKGESMEKFTYIPSYDNGFGYDSPFNEIHLDFENLKNRLIDDVLNMEDNGHRLVSFQIIIDNVTVVGESNGLWYFDFFVNVGIHRYRLGRCTDDILDFIHYFDKYVNPDALI